MLQRLGESIWAHEQFIRFGGLPLRHRMSVIRLGGGGVVLHSPTRVDVGLREEICRLGPVVAVIAPTWWHDLYLAETVRGFPGAALYGEPTLVRWNRSLPFTDVLTDSPASLWRGDLEQHHVEGIGGFLDEVVFYHRFSRSIIVADLLFTISDNDAWLTRTLARVVIGPYPGCRFPRLYRPFILNRHRFRSSIEHILEWDFNQIIVGHGDVVQSEAKDVFRDAFRWLLR
jgi:hypothetical protein